MSEDQTSGELSAYLATMQEKIRQLELTVETQRLVANTSRGSDHPKFKPIRPDTYSRRQDKTTVEVWLFQLRQYFEACKTSEEHQVPFAASLLRDNAAIWWRSHVEDADQHMVELITDWRSFKKALTDQFKPVNAVKTAKDKLASIK